MPTSGNYLGHRDWLLVTADTDNNVYFAGDDNGPNPQVFMSQTKGQTWSILTQSMQVPGLGTSAQFQGSLYNCMSMQYSSDLQHRQLVLYGYIIFISDGSKYQSLIGTVYTPIGQVGYGTLPNLTITTSDGAIGTLPSVVSPMCAYNSHVLTGSPKMISAGGLLGASTVTSTVYSSTDGVAFTAGSSLPVALYNAASVMLANSNILIMGGAVSSTTTVAYSTAVYLSTNGGTSFIARTNTSAFGAIASSIACAMPGTNTVILIGGYTSGTTMTSASWINNDGLGSTWTTVTNFPVSTVSGACVFLYDNNVISSTYTSPNSTLLVFTHTGHLYRSYDIGHSYPQVSSLNPGPYPAKPYQSLPFSTNYDNTATRYQTRVVVDYDNFIYAMAGLNVYDNSMWFR